MTVGIVSYGAFIPKLRIKAQEIARVWGKDGDAMSKGLNIISKSVPSSTWRLRGKASGEPRRCCCSSPLRVDPPPEVPDE